MYAWLFHLEGHKQQQPSAKWNLWLHLIFPLCDVCIISQKFSFAMAATIRLFLCTQHIIYLAQCNDKRKDLCLLWQRECYTNFCVIKWIRNALWWRRRRHNDTALESHPQKDKYFSRKFIPKIHSLESSPRRAQSSQPTHTQTHKLYAQNWNMMLVFCCSISLLFVLVHTQCSFTNWTIKWEMDNLIIFRWVENSSTLILIEYYAVDEWNALNVTDVDPLTYVCCRNDVLNDNNMMINVQKNTIEFIR